MAALRVTDSFLNILILLKKSMGAICFLLCTRRSTILGSTMAGFLGRYISLARSKHFSGDFGSAFEFFGRTVLSQVKRHVSAVLLRLHYLGQGEKRSAAAKQNLLKL
jgi:hypothetical protein